MSATSARSSGSTIREVSRGLASARDEQILRVVAMVDAMPNRGAADQLIAPLRERLARLRPPRPLRFARLMFLPLDPLIAPAARWRAEQPTVPRTVIPVLAAMVEATLGPVGRMVASMIEGRTTDDPDIIEAAGGLLWKHAARVLIDSAAPEGWQGTGLSIQVYQPLARRIAALLFQAERLWHMTADAAQGLAPPEAGAVQAVLADAIGHEPEVQPMIVALLLARIPECGPLLLRAASMLGNHGGPAMRRASEQAADALLDQMEAPGGAEAQLGGQDLADAGVTVRRLTSLLGALEGETLSPARRERVYGLRQRIRSGCQSLFTERLAADLLDPLRACVAESGPEAAWDLETAARGLRALETEARKAGDDKTYDTQLGRAADMVREITIQGGLGRVEGLRLMEIVAGPDVALALFGDEIEGAAGP